MGTNCHATVSAVNPSIDEHAKRIATDGYTILEGVLAPDLVDSLNDDLMRLERAVDVGPAGNSFEGAQTIRIYNLLAVGALYERGPGHAAGLPVGEAVLDPRRLVASPPSLSLLPGG